MSTVIKDLGAVSAYAYAVEKGYTGTEAEFAELMADYAEVGQRAEDAAGSALNSKTAAQTAAQTATTKAGEAQTSAQTASTKASEASQSATTASQKATEASQSASQASGYAQTAETAKTDAQTAKTQADTARDEAVTAKTAAETAQGKAEDAQAAAESVAESIPSDYSQLSEDVSDLKEGLSTLENNGYEQFGITYTYNRTSESGNKLVICPFPKLGTYLISKTGNALNLIGITNGQDTYITSLSTTPKTVELNTEYEYLGVYANSNTSGTLTIISTSSQNDRVVNIENEVKTIDNVLFGFQFTWESGYYISYASGDLVSSGRSKYVNFVPCEGIDTIILTTKISSAGASLAFYDQNKGYMQNISIKGNDSVQNIRVKIPSNAHYFRCSEYNYDSPSLSVITSISELSNRLNNKKVMFFGDSITWNENRYVAKLLVKSGMIKIHNFAVSGATLTNLSSTVMDGNPSQNSNNTVPNQVQKLLDGTYDEPDIVVISASTNDADSHFVYDENQYSFADVSDCDLTNASGAMRWMFEKIISVYPNAQVYFATPLQSASPSRTFTLLKNKRDVIVDNCRRMSVYIIDAFYKSGVYSGFEVNGENGKYLIDGLHPNANGAIVISDCYYNEICNEVRT